AGEQRRSDFGEVRLDCGERFREALLDGACKIVAQRLELLQARLEVRPLRRELGQALLLLVVLLLRERIDLTKRFAPTLVAFDLVRELVSVVALRRLGLGRLETAPRLVCSRFAARALYVDCAKPLACLRGQTTDLDLVGPETAELVGECARSRRACVSSCAQRRFAGVITDFLECEYEPLGELCERDGHGIVGRRVRRIGDRSLGSRLEPSALRGERAPPGLELEPDGFRGLAGEPDLALFGIEAE